MCGGFECNLGVFVWCVFGDVCVCVCGVGLCEVCVCVLCVFLW